MRGGVRHSNSVVIGGRPDIEHRLEHRNGEAEEFYASLPKPVRVGMEATGYAQWFERTLAKLGTSFG